MLKLRLGLYFILFVGLGAGCSSSKNPYAPGRVSGRVTYKGAAVPGGNITFHTEKQGSYNSSIGPDGTYEIVDIPTGPAVATVETESVNPAKKAPVYGGDKGGKLYAERMRAEKAMGRQIAQAAPAGQYRQIPEKYKNEKTSPLNFTIEAGRQVQEIELKD